MRDGALVEAASAVLTATGEPGGGADPEVTVFARAELQRILDRAGLDTAPEQLHWLGDRDRHDRIHLPLDAVVMIARAFAAAEPDEVPPTWRTRKPSCAAWATRRASAGITTT